MSVTSPTDKKSAVPIEQKPPPAAEADPPAKKKKAVELEAVPSLTSSPSVADFYKLAMQPAAVARSGGAGAHVEPDPACVAATAEFVKVVLADGTGHLVGHVVAEAMAPATMGGSFAVRGVVAHGLSTVIAPYAHEAGVHLGEESCPKVTVLDHLPAAPAPSNAENSTEPPFEGPTVKAQEAADQKKAAEAAKKAEDEAKMCLPKPVPNANAAPKKAPTNAPPMSKAPAPTPLATPIVKPGTYSPIGGQ